MLLEDECFMDQLHQSVSISQFLFHRFFEFLTILPITSLLSYTLISLCFSYIWGFLDLSLRLGEAAAILLKAECRLGWGISHEEIDQGHLASLLTPEDYLAPSEVSTIHIHFNTQPLTSEFLE